LYPLPKELSTKGEDFWLLFSGNTKKHIENHSEIEDNEIDAQMRKNDARSHGGSVP
jgi:hypothetical protein